jgi:hypothetical protein
VLNDDSVDGNVTDTNDVQFSNTESAIEVTPVIDADVSLTQFINAPLCNVFMAAGSVIDVNPVFSNADVQIALATECSNDTDVSDAQSLNALFGISVHLNGISKDASELQPENTSALAVAFVISHKHDSGSMSTLAKSLQLANAKAPMDLHGGGI